MGRSVALATMAWIWASMVCQDAAAAMGWLDAHLEPLRARDLGHVGEVAAVVLLHRLPLA